MQECFIIFIVSLALAGCASMYSNYSELDKQSYPKASADANTVTVLISDKDNTHFSIDGKQIGGEVQAGGELKILINRQSHDIIAQPKGYQPKPQHIQPPYDEHSPISFGFTYKDKQDNKKITIIASVPLIPVAELTPTHSENLPTPSENTPAHEVSEPVEPAIVTSPDRNNQSEHRVALVIGNSKYIDTQELTNPVNDAEDIAKVLRGFGFEVIELKNQSKKDMDKAIADFGRKISDSGAALFYFAGHAWQDDDGKNYLYPVDTKITLQEPQQAEQEAKDLSVGVNSVIEEINKAKSKTNIIILDACRDNPFSVPRRSVSKRGLAPASGTIIIYATAPNTTASDGEGRNGLFTAALLNAFKGSDLSLGGILTVASAEVERNSEKMQSPYVNGPMTLQKNFYFYPMPLSTNK